MLLAGNVGTRGMQLKISDLFATPDHFHFAFEGENAVFLEMDRAAYARSIFLDRRIMPAGKRMLSVPAGQLAAHRDQGVREAPNIGWIFHVAHCGSTLLARALDRPDRNLVIREPMALRQLGVEAATDFLGEPAPEPWRAKLRLATSLLDRRYDADGPVIVKANVPVNFIVPDLMALYAHAPALFLYFTLEHYLIAILRSPTHRKWVASVADDVRLALEAEAGDLTGLTVAQLAAALWLAQLRIYATALKRYPQAKSLDAEFLFNTPRPVLEAAFPYFGIPLEAGEIDRILAGDLFATYSKNPQLAFDNSSRLERQDRVKAELGEELRDAREWVEPRLKSRPLPDHLPNPLCGGSPRLMMRV